MLVDWSTGSVDIGKEGFINFEFDPKDRRGRVNKRVKIFSNAENELEYFYLKGFIESVTSGELKEFGFAEIERKVVKFTRYDSFRTFATFYNKNNIEITISFETNLPDQISSNSNSLIIKPGESKDIEFSISKKSENFFEKVRVKTKLGSSTKYSNLYFLYDGKE